MNLKINSHINLKQLSEIDQKTIIDLETILSDESIIRYLPFKSPPNKTEVKSFLEKIINDKTKVWGITFNDTTIGIIDLINIEEDSANLAYFLSKSHQGKGIISTAIKVVSEYAFQELKILNIIAPIVSRNHLSKRVLEKNHFTFYQKTGKKVNFDGDEDDVLLYILEK